MLEAQLAKASVTRPRLAKDPLVNPILEERRTVFTATVVAMGAIGLRTDESFQNTPVRVQTLCACQGATVFGHIAVGQNFAVLTVCVANLNALETCCHRRFLPGLGPVRIKTTAVAGGTIQDLALHDLAETLDGRSPGMDALVTHMAKKSEHHEHNAAASQLFFGAENNKNALCPRQVRKKHSGISAMPY